MNRKKKKNKTKQNQEADCVNQPSHILENKLVGIQRLKPYKLPLKIRF